MPASVEAGVVLLCAGFAREAWLFRRRDDVFDGLDYIVDGGVAAEFLDIGAVCDVFEAGLPGDLTVHRDDGGQLLFCEEEDLQHEMVAFVGAPAETGLAHEDEAGKQDCLKSDDGGEKREGRWIEVMEVRKRVKRDP